MKKKDVKFQKRGQDSITVREFFQLFPDDDTCLAHVFKNRFGDGHACPKCERSAKWYRIQAERAFSCQWCGHHIHPTVGTPFEASHTPLQLWFYAIYLFTTSRHGVSAKELERQLGVTYKTAWRMGHEIRKHMADVDGDRILENIVEIDETVIGGRVAGGLPGCGEPNKTLLFGMMERDGDIITEVVSDAKRETLLPHIESNVASDATIHTDEHRSYRILKTRGFKHETVKHGAREYARGEIHVNGIESFWKIFKDSVRSTHMHVSRKHLKKYAKEFEFRHNNRHIPKEMFPRLVSEFLAVQPSPSAQAS
ncbi:IS1595 family transposase [Prosthecobacter sp.]|uniref:IS1595 family transposase n=1 Tax=Prosthecobacter sp. TaxID=1965333 RepID=UPI002AB9831A|nr:IS1595 family transposase [Prosthecobacter sp.]MDZ4406084.1 IS1595 family transposase [Prosthecobacter sp.]